MKDGSGIVVTTLRLVSRVCATSFNVVTGIIEATEHVKAKSKVKLASVILGISNTDAVTVQI